MRVLSNSVMDKFDKQTILRLAAGAKLAVVVSPFPLVGVMLANIGLKVFCGVSAINLRSFCEGCRSLLYTDIFPLVGDHAKIPSAMPIKIDMVFFDTPERFSVRDWMKVARPGGVVAGSDFQRVRKAVGAIQPDHARGIWWKPIPGDSEAKCGWTMMLDGGANYFRGIMASVRKQL